MLLHYRKVAMLLHTFHSFIKISPPIPPFSPQAEAERRRHEEEHARLDAEKHKWEGMCCTKGRWCGSGVEDKEEVVKVEEEQEQE